jgi:hypothetical protein
VCSRVSLLLGDLNYRLLASPDKVLRLVSASVAAQQQHQHQGHSLSHSSYARFWAPADDPGRERRATDEVTRPGELTGVDVVWCSGPGADAELWWSCWGWVSGLDELEGSMAARRVLCGFHEAPKAFPPSYRFHRGPPPSDTSDSSTSSATPPHPPPPAARLRVAAHPAGHLLMVHGYLLQRAPARGLVSVSVVARVLL